MESKAGRVKTAATLVLLAVLIVADRAGAQGQLSMPEPASAPSTASASARSEQSAVVPAAEEVPATTRAAAAEQARIGSGRPDPFSPPLVPYRKFPMQKGSASSVYRLEDKPKKAAMKVLAPPPPPGTVAARDLIPHGNMVPPPPEGDMLSLKELPSPPDKPLLSGKLKLLGIVGNRAVFTITDNLLRMQHKWPRYLTLATGEQFESISVLSIAPDAVTLEEDGEKQVKELTRIR